MRISLRWRLLALVTIVIYAVLIFATIRFVIHNLAFSITVAVTSLFVGYSVWLLVTGVGSRRRKAQIFLLIALIAITAEFIYFIKNTNELWVILLFAVLSIAYVELVWLLRKQYWHVQRQIVETTQETAHFKNPYLIINPKSGNGRAIKARIDVLAKELGIETLVLAKNDDVAEVAERAARSGADVLGISGGDGSIGAVAKIAIQYKLPMVVLPGGTKCHFARDIGLDPKYIADSLAGFKGVKRQIDVGSINNRIFLNNVSFGLYADIVDKPQYRDNKLRVIRQALQDIVSGTKKPYDLRFDHDNTHITNAVQVLVSVNKYKTQSLLELGQRERLDEGILQVTALTKLNDVVMKQLMKFVSIDRLNTHSKVPHFYQWTSKVFKITAQSKELVVGVDGERELYKTPVTTRVIPAALTIYVPAEGIRNRPKGVFSFIIIKKLFHSILS